MTTACPLPLPISHRFSGTATTKATASENARLPQNSREERPAFIAPGMTRMIRLSTSSIRAMERVADASAAGGYGPHMILTSTDIGADEFAQGTSWEIKPEGACRGEVCVPLPEPDGFDLVAVADRLGMALVQSGDGDLWALGPASLG